MVRRQVLRARSLWLRLLHLGTPPRAADGGAQALHRVQGPHAQASRRQTRGGGREDQGLIARPFARASCLCLKQNDAAYSVRSPPPCGEGLGVGVVVWGNVSASPPPHKGGGCRPSSPLVLIPFYANASPPP